jgi:hypothetical protein
MIGLKSLPHKASSATTPICTGLIGRFLHNRKTYPLRCASLHTADFPDATRSMNVTSLTNITNEALAAARPEPHQSSAFTG